MNSKIERESLLLGLSSSTVLRRQAEEGFNELPSAKPRRLSHILLSVLKEPTVYLLLGCGVIYLLLGDPREALMLSGFLFLIVGITVFQERKAERALEALQEMSSPRALVIRDGERQRIAGKEVVREDIVIVSEGDRVPADAMLIATNSVASDESLLTGESVAVDKKVGELIYAGTTIVRGAATAQVTAVGAQSELGKIGKSILGVRREPTRLEIDTKKLVKRFGWSAAALCVFVVIVYTLQRGNFLEGFLVGLTLAMAILPNELPAVLTIFLAVGAWRISQRRVLTRKLPAIENLGSATVLCVDKTGTLTLNQMSIQKLYSQNSFFEAFHEMPGGLPEEFHEVLEYGILASRQDPYDPMELAFIAAGIKYLTGTEHLHRDWALEKEYPLSPELLSISHAWASRPGGGFVVGAKGAPEAILDLCHLDAATTENLLKVVEGMAKEGLRVLGVAKAQSTAHPLPPRQHDFDFTFVGFIGIADPIRPEVPQAIAECYAAGIRVLMLTGDHPLTACSIAGKIGLQHASDAITGAQLQELSGVEVAQAVKTVNIFSRVSPAQKLQLVEILKSAGEVVAMTGDGVNDAPALKAAHIGIAMGKRGTDVARESAALVILDDDCGSIVEAVRAGRRIYANLKSALSYLFAVHIPILGMSVFPVIFNFPLVLLPAHIALLHLIIEPTSSVAFEVEPAANTLMRRSPRNPRESLFDRNLWIPSILQGISILVALLLVFVISLKRGQGEEDARTLVFTTLMISNMMLIFMNRGSQESFFKKLTFTKNSAVKWIVGGSILMLGLALYIPGLREIFRFSFLHPMDIAICVVSGVLSVIVVEAFGALSKSRLFVRHLD